MTNTSILDIETTPDFLQVCVQIMDIQDLLNIYLTHVMSTWTYNLAAIKYNQNMHFFKDISIYNRHLCPSSCFG